MTNPSKRSTPAAARVLAELLQSRWAMERGALEAMRDVVQRTHGDVDALVTAVATKAGAPLENTERSTIRDGVATVPVHGPLFRYANLFTELCGATSYEIAALEFSRAVDDPKVRAIVLDIDSPGGEVNGVANFAALVAAARGRKPIIAYVSGLGASAAYWLAAAADAIAATNTAVVGSIGTVLTAVDTTARDEAEGIRQIEIVSSQSPKKRADITTEDGRAEAQRMVDGLADVFIGAVAEYRGIDVETVLADYGQGGVFVAGAALEAGLVDAIMTAEELHAALVDAAQSPSSTTSPRREAAAASPHAQENEMSTTRQAPTAGAKPSVPARRAAAPAGPKAADTPDEHDPEKKKDDEEQPGSPAVDDATGAGGASGGEGEQEEPSTDPDEEKVEGATTLRQFRAAHSRAADAIAAQAVVAERARVASIMALNSRGQAAIIATAIAEGWSKGDTAVALLEAPVQAGAQYLAGERAAEGKRPAIPPARGTSESKDADAKAADQIIAAARAANPRAVTPTRSR
jgi:signal peptide peptidase SppA